MTEIFVVAVFFTGVGASANQISLYCIVLALLKPTVVEEVAKVSADQILKRSAWMIICSLPILAGCSFILQLPAYKESPSAEGILVCLLLGIFTSLPTIHKILTTKGPE